MLLDLEEKTRVLVEDIVERSAIGRGAIFVLGVICSALSRTKKGKSLSIRQARPMVAALISS